MLLNFVSNNAKITSNSSTTDPIKQLSVTPSRRLQDLLYGPPRRAGRECATLFPSPATICTVQFIMLYTMKLFFKHSIQAT
jgi:hypothetical protein